MADESVRPPLDRNWKVVVFIRVSAPTGRAAMDKAYEEMERTRPTADFHVSTAENWPYGS